MHHLGNNILGPYVQEWKGPSLLILDTYTEHITEKLVESLKRLNIDHLYIPGGLTPVLQPLDISLNKLLNDFVRDAYSRWARNTFIPRKGCQNPLAKTSQIGYICMGRYTARNNHFWLQSCKNFCLINRIGYINWY
jgi:hypothetical protein